MSGSHAIIRINRLVKVDCSKFGGTSSSLRTPDSRASSIPKEFPMQDNISTLEESEIAALIVEEELEIGQLQSGQ